MDRAGSGTHLFGAISNRELQSGGRLLIAREGPNGVREACQLPRYPRQNLGLGCLSRILCPLLSSQRDTFRQEFWRDLLPDLPTPTRGLSWCLPAAERYDDFEVVFVHRRNMADSGALLHRLFPATNAMGFVGRDRATFSRRLRNANGGSESPQRVFANHISHQRVDAWGQNR